MSGSCGPRAEANPPLFSSDRFPENTRPSSNVTFDVDLPPMTGSLTVVQRATSLASPRSTRPTPDPSGKAAAADGEGSSGEFVVLSALADCPAPLQDTVRTAKQVSTMTCMLPRRFV